MGWGRVWPGRVKVWERFLRDVLQTQSFQLYQQMKTVILLKAVFQSGKQDQDHVREKSRKVQLPEASPGTPDVVNIHTRPQIASKVQRSQRKKGNETRRLVSC